MKTKTPEQIVKEAKKSGYKRVMFRGWDAVAIDKYTNLCELNNLSFYKIGEQDGYDIWAAISKKNM